MKSFNDEIRDRAYTELREIIEKHIVIISKTEKSRLLRERMFYKNNSVEYKKRLSAVNQVEADTTDNLVKMAIHIVKEMDEKKLRVGLKNFGENDGVDFEASNISERVTNIRARELHKEWHNLLLKE